MGVNMNLIRKKNIALLLSLFVTIIFSSACASTYKNKDIRGYLFPNVEGKTLNEKKMNLPGDLLGEYIIHLIGYKQNSQFDIDRWILALTDSGVQVKIFEIPTVVGMIPGMISSKINDGMRSGIPKELWVDVITVYGGDAKKIAQFTGNENGLNSRVILLDPKGKVIFFHDKGYAVSYLKKLIKLLPKK